MTTIPPERVKDIRDSVENHITEPNEDWLETINYPDLLAILDDYSALRAEIEHRCDQRDAAIESCSLASAENERLRAEGQRCEENYAEALHLASTYQGAAEKAEAELAAAQMTNAKNGAVIVEMMAQLERQRPLIEAVMAVPDDYVSLCPYIAERGDYWHDVHRAALKLREEGK